MAIFSCFREPLAKFVRASKFIVFVLKAKSSLSIWTLLPSARVDGVRESISVRGTAAETASVSRDWICDFNSSSNDLLKSTRL